MGKAHDRNKQLRKVERLRNEKKKKAKREKYGPKYGTKTYYNAIDEANKQKTIEDMARVLGIKLQ